MHNPAYAKVFLGDGQREGDMGTVSSHLLWASGSFKRLNDKGESAKKEIVL